MRHQFAAITICLLSLTSIGSAADKNRKWKLGRVLDSTSSKITFATGATSSTSGTSTATSNTSGTVTPGGGGANLNATTTASGQSQQTTSTVIHHMTVCETELLIVGQDYAYVIEDPYAVSGPLLKRAITNRKHGCRFIIGEDIKYVQEKGKLNGLDPDAKECRLDIVKQERVQR
jgi:hypothetical protein